MKHDPEASSRSALGDSASPGGSALTWSKFPIAEEGERPFFGAPVSFSLFVRYLPPELQNIGTRMGTQRQRGERGENTPMNILPGASQTAGTMVSSWMNCSSSFSLHELRRDRMFIRNSVRQ